MAVGSNDLLRPLTGIREFKIPGRRAGWTVKLSEIDWGDASVLGGKNES